MPAAEHEAKAISDRTRAALAAAKRRGKKLGGFRGAKITPEARAMGQKAIQARTAARTRDLALVVAELCAQGVTSLPARLSAAPRRAVARGSDGAEAVKRMVAS